MIRLAQVVAAATSALASGWPDVTHRTGSMYLADLQDPLPRVVWVPPPPGAERFGPALAVGCEPQIYRSRIVPIEVHCAAETQDESEELAHDVASVLHELLGAERYELVGGGFTSENEGGLSSSGEAYVLAVDLTFFITDRRRGSVVSTTTIDSVELNAVAALPAGDELDSTTTTS